MLRNPDLFGAMIRLLLRLMMGSCLIVCSWVVAEENPSQFTLYVFVPNPTEESYREQKYNMRKEQEGIDRRQIQVVEVFQNGTVFVDGNPHDNLAVDDLYHRYAIVPSQFVVLLIDHSQKVKLRLLRPVEIEEVFTFIDTLPLRPTKKDTSNNKA